jgi:parallel beta-helix repeat protein
VKKFTSLLVLLLFLSVVLVSLPKIRVVKADSTIYIRADGSVEGTDKIQRVGDFYTFTENVSNGPIFVEKDNIVIDGAGYTLQGGDGRGIVLSERNNVTVKNVKLEMEGGYGIYLVNASNCVVSENTVTGDAYNIYLWESFNNIIEGNTVTNAFRGILIYDSYDNTITGNLVTDGVVGIELHDCINNVFRNNEMKNNSHNFGVRAYPTYRYINDVDTSNKVDGAPIYYWVGEEDRTVPSDAGYVVLVNCTHMTVQNLHLSKNGQGILLVSTTNSTVTQNTIISTRSGRGIELVHSSNNSIIENIVQNFSTGIQLEESSYNTIAENTVAYNDRGIRPLYSSKHNTISENEITSNDYGIDDGQEPSGDNIVSGNNIIENDYGISIRSSNNIISENVVAGNKEIGIILDAGSNTLTGNTVTDNSNYGIYISGGNTLRNNRMNNNRYNFDVRETSFENDVDTSNLVDDKPIIYWINQQDKIVPSDAGYVALINCENITVQNLNIANNGDGIFLSFTNHSTITGNTLTSNNAGIRFWASSDNHIVGNNIINNGNCIFFSGATFLDIAHYPSPNNSIYHNNFIDNQNNVGDVAGSWWISGSTPAVNIWDNGIEGNYWSNYNGTDNDGDGVGDSPYIIDENNQDNCPLMAPIIIFDAGIWEWTQYNVYVISNSTVSDFSFNPEDALIQFNVTGETGTTGFCNVTIPKGLLRTEGTWIVLVDDNPIIPAVNEDASNTYLYFTYNHSTKTAEIIGTDAIPEFPSWTILPLTMIAALIVTLMKRRSL